MSNQKRLALLLFLITVLVPLGSATTFVDGLQEENINKTYNSDSAWLETSYMNQSLSYKEVLIPDVLHDDLAKWQVKSKSENGSVVDLQVNYEFNQEKDDSDGDIPSSLYGVKFDSKITLNKSGVEVFKSKGGKLNVSATAVYEFLEFNYSIEGSSESFEDVYEGQGSPDLAPVRDASTRLVKRSNGDYVESLTVEYDNRYRDSHNISLLVGVPKGNRFLSMNGTTSTTHVPHQDIWDWWDTQAEIQGLDERLWFPFSDYRVMAFNTTVRADKVEEYTLTVHDQQVLDQDLHVNVLGSVAGSVGGQAIATNWQTATGERLLAGGYYPRKDYWVTSEDALSGTNYITAFDASDGTEIYQNGQDLLYNLVFALDVDYRGNVVSCSNSNQGVWVNNASSGDLIRYNDTKTEMDPQGDCRGIAAQKTGDFLVASDGGGAWNKIWKDNLSLANDYTGISSGQGISFGESDSVFYGDTGNGLGKFFATNMTLIWQDTGDGSSIESVDYNNPFVYAGTTDGDVLKYYQNGTLFCQADGLEGSFQEFEGVAGLDSGEILGGATTGVLWWLDKDCGTVDTKSVNSFWDMESLNNTGLSAEAGGQAGSYSVANSPKVTNPLPFTENYVRQDLNFENGDKVIIRYNVTHGDGSSAIDSTYINITDPNSNVDVSFQTPTQVATITDGFTYEYNYTQTDVVGEYSITAWANDTAGIETVNSNGNFTVTDTPRPRILDPIDGQSYSDTNLKDFNYIVDTLSTVQTCKGELNGVNTTLTNCENTTIASPIQSNSLALWAENGEGIWNKTDITYTISGNTVWEDAFNALFGVGIYDATRKSSSFVGAPSVSNTTDFNDTGDWGTYDTNCPTGATTPEGPWATCTNGGQPGAIESVDGHAGHSSPPSASNNAYWISAYDLDSKVDYLISPEVDTTSCNKVWLDLYGNFGSSLEAGEQGRISVSNDGGTGWTQVFDSKSYNGGIEDETWHHIVLRVDDDVSTSSTYSFKFHGNPTFTRDNSEWHDWDEVTMLCEASSGTAAFNVTSINITPDNLGTFDRFNANESEIGGTIDYDIRDGTGSVLCNDLTGQGDDISACAGSSSTVKLLANISGNSSTELKYWNITWTTTGGGDTTPPLWRNLKDNITGTGSFPTLSNDGGGTWDYRKNFTVSGSTEGSANGYVVPVVVHYGSGTDSGRHVYLSSNSKTDFTDVRFTTTDATTELEYFKEEFTSSDKAIFWVRLDSVPADPNTKDFFIYYGNSQATSSSNGSATFEKFEGGEDSNFIFDSGSGDVVRETGQAVTGTGSFDRSSSSDGGHTVSWDSSENYNLDNHTFEFQAYWKTSLGGNDDLLGGLHLNSGASNTDGYQMYFEARSGQSGSPGIRKNTDFNTAQTGTFTGFSTGTWYFFRGYRDSSNNVVVEHYESAFFTTENSSAQLSSDVDYNSTNLGFYSFTGSNVAIDNMRVRKELTPEPSISSWSSQETDTGDDQVFNDKPINISVQGRDNGDGLDAAVLSTNETGSWKNYTNTYESPFDFGGIASSWELAWFKWKNTSFSGLLGYRVWINDTAGNINRTDTLTQQVNQSTTAQSFTEGVGENIDNVDDSDRAVAKTRGTDQPLSFSTDTGVVSVILRGFADSLSFGTDTSRNLSLSRPGDSTSSFTEIISRSLVLSRGYSNQLSFTDIFSRTAVYNRSLSETITIQDAIYASPAILKYVSDPVGIQDSVARTIVYNRGRIQNIALTSFTGTNKSLGRSLFETITFSDAASKSVALPRRISESLSIGDSVSRIFFADRSASDPVSFTDIVSRVAVFNRSSSDTVSVTDGVSQSLVLSRSHFEIVSFTSDTLTRSLFREPASQSISFQDAASRSVVFTRFSDQSISFSTAVDSTKQLANFLFSETVGVSGQPDRTIVVSRGEAEATTLQSFSSEMLTSNIFPSETLSISDGFSAQRTITRTVTQDVSVQDTVDRTVSLSRGFIQDFLIFADLFQNSPPIIKNVTLHVDELGDYTNITLDINVTDPNGNQDLKNASYNSIKKDVGSPGSRLVLDIGDNLVQNGTIIIYDNSGERTTFGIGFNLSDKGFSQSGNSANLTLQVIEVNDSVENTGIRAFNYNISHKDFDAVELDSATDTGLLSTGDKAFLYTKLKKDFLTETLQWHTRDSMYNTVVNQSIAQTLNVTNPVRDLVWRNVNTSSTSVPTEYQPCNNCESQLVNISSSKYVNFLQWTDFGDGINDEFVQDITDVVIGERSEWWDQYRYNNLTSEVRYKDIWANATLNENDTDYFTPRIQIRSGNTYDNEFVPDESNTCDTENPSTTEFNLSGNTWEGCVKDRDNTGTPEFFKLQIPEFSTWKIRYSFGPEVKEDFFYQEGDPCPDELLGDEVGDEDQFICYRNKVYKPEDIERPLRDITPELGAGLAGVLALLLLGVVVFVAIDESTEENLIPDDIPFTDNERL